MTNYLYPLLGSGSGATIDLNSVLQATPDSQTASLALSNPGINILGGISFYGDTFRINGLSPPITQATAVIASPAAPGNMDNGDHSYIYTYIGSSDGETIPGPASATVTIVDNTVNGQATITVPLSTIDPGIAQAWIYRNFNGAGKYYFVSGVTPGVPFTDNVDNGSLGQEAPDVNTSGNFYISNNLLIDGLANIGGNLTAGGGNVSLTDTTSSLSSIYLYPHVGADPVGFKISPVTSAGPDYVGNLVELYSFKSSTVALVGSVDSFGNLAVGGKSSGSNAQRVLALGNDATAPVSSTDVAQLFAKDISAGNATLALVTETAVAADVAIASTNSLTIYINGAKYKIPLVFVP